MKYKGLLLDIDNTLYDYNISHISAKKNVINYCMSKFSLSEEQIIFAYDKARDKVQINLVETAASHNRLLYFQKMCEILDLNSLKYGLNIYNAYWDSFLDNMKLFDGVENLLRQYKNKICLVTDLTAHIQFRKIQKLGLSSFCNLMVTSEEVGKEKPHPYIFLSALHKLNLHAHDVCMIGDNFKKDIYGASNVGIDAIWFNHEKKIDVYEGKKIIEVNQFKRIRDFL